MTSFPFTQVAFPPPELAEFLNQENQRQTRFGQVRPAVHANWKGLKWVAVGNQLLKSAKWKTPADFFFDYLKHVMTSEWGNHELAKPLSERHPVMQWYDSICRLQALMKQRAGPNGVYSVAPSGAMRAYLLFAYDLYILEHHNLLEPRLLHRLRHKDQYQGARHELFAAATCVRAGFDIQYENESDGLSRHTEFAAKHRHTGFSISVEAKSKHRPGVLGRTGARVADEDLRTPLRRLINDAVNKPHKDPLVIFLDLNLPPGLSTHATPEWLKTFPDPILRGIDHRGEEDPWDLLVFSNQPDHYAIDDGPAAGGYAVGMLGKNARTGSQPPSELMALIDVANKFGNLPNSFEEM
jgi:hypothetical protein